MTVSPATLPRTQAAQTLPSYASVDAFLSQYRGDDHVYAIYPDKLRAAARTFLSGFEGQTLYAVKSNPHPAVINVLWDAGVRAYDVASMREVEFMAANYPEARLYLMHPVKSRGLIARAYALGVRDFVFDCADELQKIIDCTGEARDLNLYLRLALPKQEAALPLAGKFGAAYDDAVELLRRARTRSARLGICFHVGSQCLKISAYDQAITYARKIVDAAGVAIDVLDVGGGFPVRYPDMDISPMSDYFAAISASVKANGFAGLELLAEPGRALCAEGGSTLARVELRKGHDIYLNDGAFGSLFDAAHLRWQFPVTLHRFHPPAPMTSLSGFRMFGPTCDSMDVINGPYYLPSDICESDWIEFHHLGAYGYAMATQFNGFYSDTTIFIESEV